jgi:hypothetical protein
LINSLSLADGNFTMRMLKTLELIITTLSFEEINNFLEDVKDELLEKLYNILRETKISQLHKN